MVAREMPNSLAASVVDRSSFSMAGEGRVPPRRAGLVPDGGGSGGLGQFSGSYRVGARAPSTSLGKPDEACLQRVLPKPPIAHSFPGLAVLCMLEHSRTGIGFRA